MSVNDIVEVSLKTVGPSGELMVNSLHFQQILGTSTLGLVDLTFCLEVIDDLFVNALMPIVSTDCAYGQSEIQVLTGANAALFAIFAGNGGSPGTSAGDPGPIERAICFRKRTSFTGRKNRGRMYSPKPSVECFNTEGSYLPGNPDAASIAAFLTVLNQSIDCNPGGADATFAPIIFHRGDNTRTLVTSTAFSSLVGVQRRRRIGVGT